MDLEEDANKGWLEKYLATATGGNLERSTSSLSPFVSLSLSLCFFCQTPLQLANPTQLQLV